MRLIQIILPLLFAGNSFAQINDFRGTVTDKTSGEGIVNATITISGSERAFVSRAGGTFSIPEKFDGETVEVSIIGYMLYSFKLEKGESFDVSLERNVFTLPVMNIAEKKYNGPEAFTGLSSEQYTTNKEERQLRGGEGADIFQLPAEFPGGWENLYAYVYHTFDYPQEAIDAKQRGSLYVEFMINENGKAAELTLMEGEGENGMKEAIFDALQEMPLWYPAIQNKQATPQWFMAIFPFVAK